MHGASGQVAVCTDANYSAKESCSVGVQFITVGHYLPYTGTQRDKGTHLVMQVMLFALLYSKHTTDQTVHSTCFSPFVFCD